MKKAIKKAIEKTSKKSEGKEAKKFMKKAFYPDSLKKKVVTFYKKHTLSETVKEFNISSASVFRWSTKFR